MLANSTLCSNLLSSMNPVINFKHGITDTLGPSNGICTSPSKLSGLDNENSNNNIVSVTNTKLGVLANELKQIIYDIKEEIKVKLEI